MTNLYLLSETFTNGLYYDLLDGVSIISIFCGLFVIITKNPIVSVLFLIGLFLSIATYLMMLGIHFIGLSYLLVYVGAVSILFLFILMLINVRISELVTDNNNSVPLAIMIGIIFSYTLYYVFPSQFKGSSFFSHLFDMFGNTSAGSDKSLGFAQKKLIDLYHSHSSSYITSETGIDSSNISSLLQEDFVKGQELYFATTQT